MTTPFSQFYGRRTGRRLHKARTVALQQSLPRYEIVLPENGRLAPAALFPQQVAALWLEIGFGNGEHLLTQAMANPQIGFIGCEPFMNGVTALILGIEEAGLTNIRIFPEDARLLLRVLPDACLQRGFVLFADPWPKTRHNRRRIINPDTLAEFTRVLTEDGELYLATDSEALAGWYRMTVAANPAFTLTPAIGGDAQTRPDWPVTRYEEKARDRGTVPFYYRVKRNF